jgi:hypothetical protein
MNLEKYFKKYAREDIQNYQKLLVQEIEKNKKTIICKARQMGITHLVLSYLAFLFENTAKDIVVVCYRPKSQIETFKTYLKYDIYKLGNKFLKFGPGSITFTSCIEDGTKPADIVYIDEMCFLEDDKKDFSRKIRKIAQGKLIISSTPGKFKEGNFYNIWQDESGEWEKAHLPYCVNENFDDEWLERWKKDYPLNCFRREILAEFV